MTIQLKGRWRLGFTFDVHTLESVHLGLGDGGRDRWESNRSEMGQLLYDLKYRGDRSKAERIAEILDGFGGIESVDAIVPAPSSNVDRSFQPVVEIAKSLGARRGVPVIEDLLFKEGDGSEIKNVDSFRERSHLLRESIRLNEEHDVRGQNILLIDDLFRSGATLTVATELLYDSAGARDVFVFALTKTRSRK